MKKQGTQVLFAAFLMLFFVFIGIIIGYRMKAEQVKSMQPHTETLYNPPQPDTISRAPIE